MMTFEELEALRRNLQVIEGKQVASLRRYHDGPSNGFYHRHDERMVGHFSKSSTATCVLSLTATGRWTDVAGPNTEALVRAMLDARWESAGLLEDNVFTVAFILEACIALKEFASAVFDEEHYRGKVYRAEGILSNALSTGHAQIEPYGPSAYLTQLALRTLSRSRRALNNPVPDLSHVREWAWREIDHHLALLLAASPEADVFQLAYSIIIAADLSDPAAVTPDFASILRAALAELFRRQLPDGSWPRSRPLFHYPDVGNAYCYEYEMLVQLLQVARLANDLLRYMPNLAKAVLRLNETAYPLGDDGSGWSSGHHPQLHGPESWSTASVFHFAHSLERLVAEAIRRVLFELLDTPYTAPLPPRDDPGEFAPGLLDCPVYIAGVRQSLKTTIFESFVRPLAKEAGRIRAGGSLSQETPMSAIFFGPPGTSKTELTRYIADYLRWPRLIVDPSYLVRNGMDHVQAQADLLFSMLSATEQVVVLLDEFDEMMRERSGAPEVLSRFLTTAMLPKLANLNRQRRIVFIVATNHIDYFDLAVRRRGRFDMILQVLPPTTDEKLRKWPGVNSSLQRLGVDVASLRDRLDDLTFDEFRALAPKIEGAVTAADVNQVVNEAHGASTLSDRTLSDQVAAQEGPTWKELSDTQHTKTRLPL